METTHVDGWYRTNPVILMEPKETNSFLLLDEVLWYYRYLGITLE